MSVLKNLLVILLGLPWVGVNLWVSGALFYDAASRNWWGILLVLLWALAVLVIFLKVKPFWLASLVFFAAFLVVLVWWFSQRPSHQRDWDPNFAKLPEFLVDGDKLTVTNVRNTNYRSLEDYDVRFETREYRLSNLRGLDVIILNWGSDLMSHPIAVFDFGGRHLSISIEVRYRKNESYDIFRGLYRQNELMYVVADERDAILRRTKYANGQTCYLYRFQLSTEECRSVLDGYITQTNDIYREPRWYNVVTANCTTSIYRQQPEMKWDWRILFNGSLDRMFYERGGFFQGLAFEELKRQSRINDRANRADVENFSREIRRGLPGFEDVDPNSPD